MRQTRYRRQAAGSRRQDEGLTDLFLRPAPCVLLPASCCLEHESPGSSRERGAEVGAVKNYFLLTAFLSSAPAVNLATLLAAILMGLPV